MRESLQMLTIGLVQIYTKGRGEIMSDKVEIKAKIEAAENKIDQIESEQKEVEGQLLRVKENNRAGRGGAKSSIGKRVAAKVNADKGAIKAQEHYFNN